MSELKATTAQEIVQNEKDCDYMDELFGGVKMPPTQVYLKFEADKVIAELEESHNMEVEQLLLEIVELKKKLTAAQQVLRLNKPEALFSNLETMGRLNHEKDVVERREIHHKHKRCLANARIAQDDWHLHNSFYAMGHQEFEKRKCDFYDKWHKRWLKIAEQFKEADK